MIELRRYAGFAVLLGGLTLSGCGAHKGDLGADLQDKSFATPEQAELAATREARTEPKVLAPADQIYAEAAPVAAKPGEVVAVEGNEPKGETAPAPAPAGPLAARHGCSVYLRNPDRRFDEGLGDLKPYRRLWWGEPPAYEPVEMPERIAVDGTELRALPIPGHSATHTALLHEPSGTVLTGDLFITGGATAVMSHENPFDAIASLRRVAALELRRMLTGHALVVETPAPVLRKKADTIEVAAARVLALHASGAAVPEIVRRVFPNGRAHDLMMGALTGGEFSRTCFVRACLRYSR